MLTIKQIRKDTVQLDMDKKWWEHRVMIIALDRDRQNPLTIQQRKN